ncbi:hypothetical protein D3C72_2597470 [compost metagenome]
MLRSHALRLKNDRDISLQPFQKKRASNGTPTQRPPQMAISLAGLNRRTNEPAFAPSCSQR